MSNIIPVPTLSPNGWVIDVGGKADSLLAYFYESMKSQTYVYGSNVTSLQFILQQYGSNMNNFTQKLQDALEIYLNRYYDLAVVSVSSNATDAANKSTSVEVKIHCQLTENGINYSVGSLLRVSNSKILAVTKINNG